MRRLAPFLPVLLLVPALGCSDDPAAPQDELTPTERQILAGAVIQQSVGEALTIPIEEPSGTSDGPDAAPVALNFTATSTLDCAVSGIVESEANITGTIDDQNGAAEVTITLTQEPIECVVQNTDGTVQLQIDGTPGTAAEIDITRSNLGSLFVAGELASTILVTASDGRSNSCTFLLSFNGTGSEGGTVAYNVSGSLCGVPFTGTAETAG